MPSPPATRKVYWARNSPSVEYVLLVRIVQIFAINGEELHKNVNIVLIHLPYSDIFGPMTLIFGSFPIANTVYKQYLKLSDQELPKTIEHIGFTCLVLTYLLNIGQIFAFYSQYLVQ